MSTSPLGGRDADRTYRRSAQLFFESLRPRSTTLPNDLRRAYGDFEAYWSDYFVPSRPERRDAYLALPNELRADQFDRFRRACIAWTRVFEVLSSGTALGRARTPLTGDPLRQRLAAHAARQDALRDLYTELHAAEQRGAALAGTRSELERNLAELGLDAEATPAEVTFQYRRLVKENHPDRTGADGRMRRINDAYRFLLEHHRRAG